MILIFFYDSFAECRLQDGGWIYSVATKASPFTPEWEDAETDWKWRDVEQRPTIAQLAMFYEYRLDLDRCQKLSDAPYRDKNGLEIDPVGNWPAIDRRYHIERRKLVNKLLKLYGITEEDFAVQLQTVFNWRYRMDLSPAAIRESAIRYREEWNMEGYEPVGPVGGGR